MTPLTSPPITRARGLLVAVLDLAGGTDVDPGTTVQVAKALNELTPAAGFPTYPTDPVPIDDPAGALTQARRDLRMAIAYEGDVDALRQIGLAIRCVDAALTVSP